MNSFVVCIEKLDNFKTSRKDDFKHICDNKYSVETSCVLKGRPYSTGSVTGSWWF